MPGSEERIREYIELLDPRGKYIISFSPFFINHISVELMTEMVAKKKLSILYLCIGRPHIFVQKILKNRGISHRSIYFMDMILHVCRECDQPNPSRIIIDDEGLELDLPTIFKLYRVDQELYQMKLDNVDLVVIDNLSELRTYNTNEQTAGFLKILQNVCDQKNIGLFMLHLNNRPGDGIPDLAVEMGSELVEMSS